MVGASPKLSSSTAVTSFSVSASRLLPGNSTGRPVAPFSCAALQKKKTHPSKTVTVKMVLRVTAVRVKKLTRNVRCSA